MEKKRDSFFLPDKKNNLEKKFNKEKKQDLNAVKNRQYKFDKNRTGFNKNKKPEGERNNEENNANKEGKKPFDKKTYRLKKYSKKYKLEQWEEKRKKKLLHNYHKDMKNDPLAGTYSAKIFDEDVTDNNDENVGRFVKHPDLIEKENNLKKTSDKDRRDPFWKAKDHYNKIKQEKLEKREEIERIKEEKRQKMLEYKKKKQERFKKLSKKTKKGQPVMTGRLELLLEKIQHDTKKH